MRSDQIKKQGVNGIEKETRKMPKFMRYCPCSQKAQKGKIEQTRPFKDTTVKRTLTIKKRAAAKRSYTPVLENT